MAVSPRSPLAPVTTGILLAFGCWKMVAPLLPLWAGHLGATPLLVGVLLTVFSAAELVAAPMFGALSDRIGRKPVIVVSLALSTVSFAMIAHAGSLPTLLVAQAVGGFGAAIVSVGQAAVADRVDPGRLAPAMAYLAAAIGVAYVLGPALGAVLTGWGRTAPFWAAAALAGVNTVLIWSVLPETRAAAAAPVRVRWRDLLRAAGIPRLALTTLVFGSVIVTLEAVLPLFTNRVLGWAEAPNAWLFAYLGAVIAAMQLGVVARGAARFGERPLVLAGLVVAALGLLLLGAAATAVPVVVAVGLIGAGTGVVIPLLPTLFCLASPESDRGAVLGFAQGLIALARLVGPMVAAGAFSWLIGAPFVIVGLLCLAGVAVLAAGRTPQSAISSE
ncbi:MFS transporter [Mycobacterium sp. M1]|uniref:MFS transporter n=1 Tax=Mycolicibacter acidiphilus TaxID=2835306 RepID=A0ABS5RGD0_9MYCO|nr:MFS transporter [Mycolicibacter acidiphilus]MBS9533350.1 MFS transporter [Mycolicibacter acidiphilus]